MSDVSAVPSSEGVVASSIAAGEAFSPAKMMTDISAAVDDDVVKMGETAMLLMNDGARMFVVVKPAEHVRLKKASFDAKLLVGAAYGTVYDVTPKKTIELVESGELIPDVVLETPSGADNRSLVDDNTSQSLTSDDIARMRSEGKGGTEIISALIENSATFATKTVFSQEKYIRKKQQKYLTRFRVCRPDAQHICDSLLERQPEKMCGLRSDSLAQLVTAANVRVGARILVVDAVGGVLLGAVAERMGNSGVIICMDEDKRLNSPSWAHMQKYNLGRAFDTTQADHIKIFTVGMQHVADWGAGLPTQQAAVAVSGHKRPRPDDAGNGGAPPKTKSRLEGDRESGDHPVEKLDETAEPSPEATATTAKAGAGRVLDASNYHIVRPAKMDLDAKRAELEKGVDSVIIAGDLKPNLLLLAALRFARPSAAVSVFCAELQPLAETFRQLKQLQLAAGINLQETWFRSYQVLPNRTHPTMSMHGASGYFLSGTVLENDFSAVKLAKT